MNRMPKRLSLRSLVMFVAATLSVGCAVGSTVAWLTDSAAFESASFIDSTVSVSVSDITATDDGAAIKMVPGHTVDKAPMVTVNSGSEDCYLFIKIDEIFDEITVTDEEGNTTEYCFEDYISYSVIEADDPEDHMGWVQLTDADDYLVDGVYYRIVRANEDTDQSYYILDHGSYLFDGVEYEWTTDEILVNPDVTLDMMEALTDENFPSLSITAHAIQYYKSNELPFEAHEAWANISY